MSHLVYCIMREDPKAPAELPLDGCGRRVSALAEQGLLAAVSQIPEEDIAPTVGRLQAFAAVIESLHAVRTVLPMRYGCLVPNAERVAELLRERGAEFASALDGVEGCVEMSIRAILDGDPGTASTPPPCCASPDVSGGKQYLASRKALYARQTLSATTADALGERAVAVFRGLFVRHVSEYAPLPSGPCRMPVLSLHFLVRRSCIESFRSAFEMLDRNESAKMLLSGPWPPYNLVQPVKGVFR